MSSPVSMTDAIRQAVLYQLGNIHTALPGSIISYDYTTQKASIQPLLNKVWSYGDPTPMPILENVPVIFPRAGGASLTFPVAEGDTCLLVFIERSIDLWKTSGGQVNPDDSRKLDLSDGVAIMGLSPFSETSLADNNEDVLLTYKGSSIRIKSDGEIDIKTSTKIAIGTAATEVLNVLEQALSFLANPVAISVPGGGSPYVGPLADSVQAGILQAQINAIKGSIT